MRQQQVCIDDDIKYVLKPDLRCDNGDERYFGVAGNRFIHNNFTRFIDLTSIGLLLLRLSCGRDKSSRQTLSLFLPLRTTYFLTPCSFSSLLAGDLFYSFNNPFT